MPSPPIARFIGAVVVATWALQSAPMPLAAAQPCPDVEVVFARGTYEPPGVGGIGQEFVEALRTRAAPRSVDVYPVNYPASTDFPTAVDGIRDAATHIQATAANCPDTKMVLGGFSQGAAVMGFVTADAVPDGVLDPNVPQPMPPEVAEHVAAVALFGKPSNQFMGVIGSPPVTIGPLYTDKTIDLCVPNDPICADQGEGWAHNLYETNGMVNEGAAFAVSRLEPQPAT